MKADRKHPLYVQTSRRRKLALDLYEGGERVEGTSGTDQQGYPTHSGGCYLVRHAYEEAKQWEIRKTRAAYRNFVAPIVDLFASYINKDKPERELPEALQALALDADRMGTDATVFFETVTRHAAAAGAVFVLVDMEPQQGATQAENREAGRRDIPYFVNVRADDVWDWQIDSKGLAWASIHGMSMEERQPGESVTYRETITVWTRSAWIRYARVLSDEQVNGSGYVAENDAPFAEEARGTHPCGAVPLVPFIFEETSPMTGLAAADDVLSLVLKLFRNDSEMDKMLFDRAIPEKVVTGLDPEQIEDYKTSSYNCLMHHQVDGIRAYYVEPQGTSFEALARQIEKDEAAIREIALRILRPMSAVGESAEAKRLDNRQLDTQLATYARACASAESRCWLLAAQWLGVAPDGIVCAYQENYDVEEADSILTDRLLALSREGVVSKATLLKSEAVKSILPKDFDPEENARELRDEGENVGPVGSHWNLETALRGDSDK